MVFLALFLGACARGAAEQAGIPLNFKVGELTEEESKSDVIPAQFRCPACKAVVFQVQSRLDKLNLKDPTSLDKPARREQAVRVAEILEEACSDSTYKDYGIKELAQGGGGKVLSGPGIDTNEAGVLQGGGKWPKRIGGLCRSLVEEEDLSTRWPEGSLGRYCEKDCLENIGGTPLSKTRPKKRPPAEAAPKTTSKPHEAAKPTGLEELPPPPHQHKVVTAENISDVITQGKFHKFVLVLFFDASERSAHAVAIWEYAARLLKKAKLKDLRKAVLARYDSSSGDTWGYKFQGPLPRGLLYRKGYRNPKKFDGKLDGPQDLVDWLKEQSANYMKDDPDSFPRLSGSEL